MVAPSQQGWQEAFAKLDAALANPGPSEEFTCPLTYINNMSLDGYVEDPDGHDISGRMSDDVFAAYTDLLRPVSTHLYGRRLYETMPSLAAQSTLSSEFSDVWKSADKVVYSTTLATTSTASTRIKPSFDATGVQQLKATTTGDLTIGGANLAFKAAHVGLLDECHVFTWPTTVGSGKPSSADPQQAQSRPHRRTPIPGRNPAGPLPRGNTMNHEPDHRSVVPS